MKKKFCALIAASSICSQTFLFAGKAAYASPAPEATSSVETSSNKQTPAPSTQPALESQPSASAGAAASTAAPTAGPATTPSAESRTAAPTAPATTPSAESTTAPQTAPATDESPASTTTPASSTTPASGKTPAPAVKSVPPTPVMRRPAGIYSNFSTASSEETNLLSPGTNLILQGIPKPPLSLVDDINRYTEFRRAAFCDWHPTKRQMLIETRFGDTSQVHLLANPLGAREQLTFYRDASHGATYPPANSEIVVFNKDSGGDEFFQKYAFNVTNKKVTLLTDGKSRNTGGVWSTSGNRLAYGSTRRTGKDVDLYIVSPNNPSTTRLLCQLDGGGWSPVDWSPDDKAILMQEEISINESRLWLIDTKFGAKTLLAPAEATDKAYYGDAKFSKDGKGVYMITDKDAEFQRLTYIDLTTKQQTCLSEAILWDILEFDLSLDGTKIAFVANEDGWCKMHMLDTRSTKEIPLPDLPKGQVSGLRWHRNSQDLAFNLENAQTPSDIYSMNIDTGSVDRWTESETGMVDLRNARFPELVHWPSFDDKQISGFLYQPPKSFKGKRPVLINIHGGPESQWRPRFLGATNYLLDEMGIAIIYPNVRGSMGYGKSFSQMDNGLQRSDSYKDIGALIEWIKGNPTLDSDRIMIMGGSYGGNMTLACSMLYNDKIKCSLDAFGPSNFVTFLKNTQPYRQDLRRVEYGDERDPKVAAFLEDIAPLNHAEMIKKPLFVVQGDNDPRVPVSESDQMVKAVRGAGTPVWYLRAKDEGHGFNKKVNSDYLFFTMVEFIKQYLLD